MERLKGSQTLLNLMKAFAGESQARNRYLFYAKTAYKEGYKYLHDIFVETADNEYAHAKLFFEYLCNDLKNGTIPVSTEYPIGFYKTHENLLYAAAGENEEFTTIYPTFEKIAREEGFQDIAGTFKMITEVEKHHEERFMQLANELGNGSLYKKEEKVYWKCLHCGHVHYGTSAPETCPLCKHPQGYFYVVKDVVMD